MRSARHSGTLGDLIYSLSILRKFEGPINFQVALHNIENCVAKYGYKPEEVDPAHKGRFTEKDFELLGPLLARQSYIQEVSTWKQGDLEPDVDLDHFRGTLFRGFEGNYVQAYYMAFGIPFEPAILGLDWLEADPLEVKPIVISRTPRYRCPNGDESWKQLMTQTGVVDSAIFVGTEEEHADFCRVTNTTIPHHVVEDFLELANVVAGAQVVAANQNFVYSLAMGLGKPAILETIKIKPLEQNECYFPRTNCQYF